MSPLGRLCILGQAMGGLSRQGQNDQHTIVVMLAIGGYARDSLQLPLSFEEGPH